MNRNALRTELNNLLAGTSFSRLPALRRSLREDWLYATDLPSLCRAETLRAVRLRLEEAGWETESDSGWLQLRKEVLLPLEELPDGFFGPEAACCRSLLERHPVRGDGYPRKAVFLLAKAAEEGPLSYEKACGRLHREWAERLRKNEPLPGIDPRFFGHGTRREQDAVDSYRPCGVSD